MSVSIGIGFIMIAFQEFFETVSWKYYAGGAVLDIAIAPVLGLAKYMTTAVTCFQVIAIFALYFLLKKKLNAIVAFILALLISFVMTIALCCVIGIVFNI
ncbi:hypothetical protein IV62_GL000100 [Lactobacillus helveticus]|nr:hypothetical protein IV62_GL000100 [Lactobacillus helveticus]